MKKIINSLFVLIITLVMLTGCSAKQQDTIVIDKDKKVSFKTTIAMDDEMLESIIKISSGNEKTEVTDEMKWEYLDNAISKYKEYDKEKYDKDGYKGYTLTYKNKLDLDSLTTTDNIDARYVYSTNDDINVAKLFKKDGNSYVSNIKVQQPDEYQALSNNESSGKYELIFTMVLPNKAISNNADEVSKDGKTLTWKVTEPKNIELKFEVKKTSIFVYILVVLIAIAFVVSLVFMIKRKK